MRDTIVILEAVSRRLPPGSAFSGRTAGWLHGLDLPPCAPIEVTVSPACGVSTRSGVVVRRVDLPRSEITTQRGLCVTAELRTVTDLARYLPLVDAVVAVDQALHDGLVELSQLGRFVIESPPRRRGIAQLRSVIELAEPLTESPMETRLRLVLVQAGLPRPEAQVRLYGTDGVFIGRPDFVYRDAHLVIEFDGGVHRDLLERDDRRQNLLVDAGYRVLRYTSAAVLRTPDIIVPQVAAALGLGRGAGTSASGRGGRRAGLPSRASGGVAARSR